MVSGANPGAMMWTPPWIVFVNGCPITKSIVLPAPLARPLAPTTVMTLGGGVWNPPEPVPELDEEVDGELADVDVAGPPEDVDVALPPELLVVEEDDAEALELALVDEPEELDDVAELDDEVLDELDEDSIPASGEVPLRQSPSFTSQ
ncbi:MAG: hypothetical protein AB2A00_30695 [Myxococcota bacterium]